MTSQTLLLLFAIILAIVALVGMILKYRQETEMSFFRWFVIEWLPDFSTEAAGAVLSILIVSIFIGSVQQSEDRNRLLQENIKRMGNTDNVIALQAVEELRLSGALTDGSLHQALFVSADLHNAPLSQVDLWRADLRGVNLSEADLWSANLEGADLRGADLSNAVLWQANLTNADLSDATLNGARLPDNSQWTPETDMARFTDPTHPDFWQPDWIAAQLGTNAP